MTTSQPAAPKQAPSTARLYGVVCIAALGYFVDVLDLFLFNVLRTPSLTALQVPKAALLQASTRLINTQMLGLLLGSVLWGILGDRRGRVRALFGSILLYSLATLANGFVQDLTQYTVCRFLAGLGLAGELGAAITLVSEVLPKEKRGIGTAIVASFGLCGGMLAATLGERLDWRTCYLVGGSLGLLLLVLRFRLRESPLFGQTVAHKPGSLRLLFATSARRRLYLRLVLAGVPVWYVAGILIVFSPELGRALGLADITAARAVFWSYLGTAVGDLLCGLFSQALRSRRQAIGLSLVLVLIACALYLHPPRATTTMFYALCVCLGLGTGYWAVLVTTAAESVGTNLRATVSTTIPNVVRASLIPLNYLFVHLLQRYGTLVAAQLLGILTLGLAGWALWRIPETFGRSLDFHEQDPKRP